MSRTAITLNFKMCLFLDEASYWAETLLKDINLPHLMPYADNKFGGSLGLDFRKWWRHVQPNWVLVHLNLTSKVSSGDSDFLPPQNWLVVYSNSIPGPLRIPALQLFEPPWLNKVIFFFFYWYSALNWSILITRDPKEFMVRFQNTKWPAVRYFQ